MDELHILLTSNKEHKKVFPYVSVEPCEKKFA